MSYVSHAITAYLRAEPREKEHFAKAVVHLMEAQDLVITPEVLKNLGLDPALLPELRRKFPQLAFIPNATRYHAKLTPKERRILDAIGTLLPTSSGLATAVKALHLGISPSTAEIVHALRKSGEFIWTVSKDGLLHAEWKNPSVAQRIRHVLTESSEAMSREEIESRMLEPLPHSKLHYAIKNAPDIFRLDRNLYGLKKHQRFNAAQQSKAAKLLASWVATDPVLDLMETVDRLRSELHNNPPHRYELKLWLMSEPYFQNLQPITAHV